MTGRAIPVGGKDTWCEHCGKVLLPTRRRAEQVAGRQRLRLYECPHGPGFHLGHRPRRERQDNRTHHTFQGSVEDLHALAEKMRQEAQA